MILFTHIHSFWYAYGSLVQCRSF